jgi:hypothetical protein
MLPWFPWMLDPQSQSKHMMSAWRRLVPAATITGTMPRSPATHAPEFRPIFRFFRVLPLADAPAACTPARNVRKPNHQGCAASCHTGRAWSV